jgi:hypothetical protein
MVTLAQIVGSSAIKTCRITGQRNRNHHALAHAAGKKLVRMWSLTLWRVGMPTSS